MISSKLPEFEPSLRLRDDITSLLVDPSFHDLDIICTDGITIRANSIILAARSAAFKAKLRSRSPDIPGLTEITLDDISSASAHIILRYLHTEMLGPASLDPLLVVEAYKAASIFQLPNLMKMILEQTRPCIAELGSELTSMLNAAVAAIPPNETNTDLYDMLLKPLCERCLGFNDLNNLTIEAMEVFLSRTRTTATRFETCELKLLLCVVNWAWCRAKRPPNAIKRVECLRRLTRWPVPSTEPYAAKRIRLVDERSRTSLLLMMRHIDLRLICPHRLKSFVEAIDVFAVTSPAGMAFAFAFTHLACATINCSPDHKSGTRATPHYEWDRSYLGVDFVISEDDRLVEFPNTLDPCESRTARISIPFKSPSDRVLWEWDIVVESEGTRNGFLCSSVGLVGEAFDRFDATMESVQGEQPAWCLVTTLPYGKVCWSAGGQRTEYGQCLRRGTVVTFHLNMNERCCAISIDGTNYGIAWRNLPDTVYAAVSFYPGAKYRFKHHA